MLHTTDPNELKAWEAGELPGELPEVEFVKGVGIVEIHDHEWEYGDDDYHTFMRCDICGAEQTDEREPMKEED